MAKKKKKEEHECESAGGLRWLITYADMITLLLGVFIILVGTSAITESKYEAMTKSFSRVFSLFPGSEETGTMPGKGGAVFPQKTGAQPETPEVKYKKQVATAYKEAFTLEKVKNIQTRRGLIFRIPDTLLFVPGSDQLLEKSFDELDRIARFIEKLPNKIKIEGHTDATPIQTKEFPSNWELSIARADSVRQYLFDQAIKKMTPPEFEVYRKRFSVSGFSQFKPAVDDPASPENRRVDIIVVSQSEAEIQKKILSE
ncbi:MAG: flagellar motor protein MotB [bacterium]